MKQKPSIKSTLPLSNIEGKISPQFLSVSLTQMMGCSVKIFDLFQLFFPHIIIQKKKKQKGKKTHSNTH